MATNAPRRVWWQDDVIYQIYPRSFQDSDGDGIGDLAGIARRLPYLESLGVGAVWLSPFYPSPMADFGYDVSDYTNVDPRFGTLEDLDALLRDLHAHGLKLVIDYVPNHSSEEHPWFRKSRSSRDNPKRNWYIWRDARPGGGPPNNWLSIFGGPAWEWDEATEQYYLHSFLKEQPDLNWRNPEVRKAMLDVLRFWLDRGVDGFRLDAAHLILKDPDLRDNPPNPATETVNYKSMGEFDTQLHLYDRGHPDVHAAFRDMRKVLDQYSGEHPRCAVAEIHIFDWSDWAEYYGTQLDEIHMPFNFGLLDAPWTAVGVRQVVDAIEAAVPRGGWPNYVLGNHDEHRIATRLGRAGARLATMLLLTLRGTPTVYYGDEIGMTDVQIPPEMAQDPWGLNVRGLGLGRDPERTPMQWDSGPNGGFCPPAVTPWLPLAPDYREVNVAVESDDPRSMLTLNRRLLAIRRASPALAAGDYRPIDDVPADCFVYTRESPGQSYLVALNFADQERKLSLAGRRGSVIVSTHLDREGAEPLDGFALRPNEGCLCELLR